MGVIEVWVVDPAARSVMICAGVTMVEHTNGVLQVPETPITISSLGDIFKALDDY